MMTAVSVCLSFDQNALCLIRFLLKKYEMATYSAILGFVIGSIPAVFPGFGAMSIGAVICLIAGVAAIVLCNKFGAE